MVLQLENFDVILKALIPGIDLIFIFYHYYGNDKGIQYSLNVTNMNIGYGR